MLNPDTVRPGDVVTYEDRANPLTYFVVESVNDNPWSTFEVRELDTGDRRWTDGRQRGWES